MIAFTPYYIHYFLVEYNHDYLIIFLYALDSEKHDIPKNLEQTSTNNAAIAGDYPYENDYFILRDRDGDPIPDDWDDWNDLDACILRDCNDLVADHSPNYVPSGLVRPVPDSHSSRRHGRVHLAPARTSHRNLRVHSPDHNYVRPRSPDDLYLLVVDDSFLYSIQ